MANSRFVYVTYIRATQERVWQALTDPEFTRQYWVESWHESEWTPGASWKLVVPGGRVADQGQIVECDPPRHLCLLWQNELFPDAHAEGFSRLTIDLEPEGSSVKITLVHEMEREDSKLIQATSQGWPHILASLKSLLETGEPLVETTRWPEGL